MRSYYRGKRAVRYNQTWKRFSEKTLAMTCSTIDFKQLQGDAGAREGPLRVLDVACGTGLLLQSLVSHLPHAELYGVDESQEMLDQARLLLKDYPRVHLARASLSEGHAAGLPYEPASFDLITCTNALHYFQRPVAVLQGLAGLLAPWGQFVLEDYARRGFPFPWELFEWFIRRVDPQHVRAFTLKEAQDLCQQAGLQVVGAKYFPVDLLWQGWVIRAQWDGGLR